MHVDVVAGWRRIDARDVNEKSDLFFDSERTDARRRTDRQTDSSIGACLNTQFTPPARQDKTVLSVSCRAV